MIEVNINGGYYDWLEKIILYVPECDPFNFKEIVDKILISENYKTTLATHDEIRTGQSTGYTAEDIFFTLFGSGFIATLAGADLSDNVETGNYQLTDKGRSLKENGNWFDWHAVNK